MVLEKKLDEKCILFKELTSGFCKRYSSFRSKNSQLSSKWKSYINYLFHITPVPYLMMNCIAIVMIKDIFKPFLFAHCSDVQMICFVFKKVSCSSFWIIMHHQTYLHIMEFYT